MKKEELETLCLGRMPVLTRNMEIAFYELLFVDADQKNIHAPKDYKQSAKLVGSALNLKGLKQISGEAKVLVAADKDFLLHDMVLSIPDNFIFYIPVSIELCETLRARLRLLSGVGISFALLLDEDSFEKHTELEEIRTYFDHIVVTMNTINSVGRKKAIAFLDGLKISAIIKNVEKKYEMELFEALDHCYFQGYFFADSEMITPDMGSTKAYEVIDLCNLLSTESTIKEMAQAFLEKPDISLQLLQYINSTTFYFKKNISSIEQLITLLGREKLRYWLLLTLYSSMKENVALTPLMKMLYQRLALLSSLHEVVDPKATSDQKDKIAFLGLLSLMDRILQRPMSDILERLSLDAKIKEALVEQKNPYGELLSFAIAIEKFDLLRIHQHVNKFGIRPQQIENFLAQSVRNTHL